MLRLHPDNLAGSADRLSKFLSGWFGGPPLYIGERGQWLLCMCQALDEVVADETLRVGMLRAFTDMAAHVVNAGPGRSDAGGSWRGLRRLGIIWRSGTGSSPLAPTVRPERAAQRRKGMVMTPRTRGGLL